MIAASAAAPASTAPAALAEDPIDQLLPPARLAALGFQHVLVMYAGAVAVPLIVGHALALSPAEIGLLVSADLFAGGIATLIQSLGLRRLGIGIRLPVMMGVTFASVAPMLAIARGVPGTAGLPTIYGAVIVAGLFGFVAAPLVSRLRQLFPAVVTGSVILTIGISLVRIGIGWVGGGQPGDPGYGAPSHLLFALIVLVLVLALARFGRGMARSGAVLIGIAIGTLAAALFGLADFGAVSSAPWLGLVTPFRFGMPRFEAGAALSMCLVMIVVMVESFGMFVTLGEMVGRPADDRALARGLRGDALGTLIGGLFNTFPYTSFSQNVGLVAVTGIRSRYVCAAGGGIMLLLGLSPKLAAVVASVPSAVLGGAGLVMFGMIAATGVRVLAAIDFARRPHDPLIIAVALSVGMIPLAAPTLFQYAPPVLGPLLNSGILLATLVALLLNLLFNGRSGPAPALATIAAEPI